MHIVDTTMFYGPRSGGVKRYLAAKRAWLQRNAPSTRHSLLVPGPSRGADEAIFCDAFAIDLRDGYRLPLDLRRWGEAIVGLRPDVIEAGDPYVPGWATRLAANRLGVPSIAFYHSDMPRMLAARVGSWIRPIARSYLRRLYAGFDLVLAPSTAMLEQLHAAQIHHAALQPLGVDTALFDTTPRDLLLRPRLGLPAETRLLVYAGRFAKEKNIPALIATAERLGEPYHLLLIGGRRRERLNSCVTILPYQRNTERLARLLASCDVFVHAGAQETYGLIAAEAMACGLPVVGVQAGAIPELVDDTVGALVQTPRPKLLAEAIAALYTRDLQSLRRSARMRAQSSHSWDAVFHSILSRYSSLASNVSSASLPLHETELAR